MMGSPMCKLLAVATWLITALVSINEGAEEFGYSIRKMEMLASNPKLMMYLHYVVGVAGVISLIMLIMSCMSAGCHCCGHKSCSCCNKGSCNAPAAPQHHNKI